jgi:mono/diheme cytochrome c family protein
MLADDTRGGATLPPVRRLAAAGVVFCAIALAACSERGEVQTPAQRGEQFYRNVCTTCHGIEPDQDGVIGPAIAGASLELIEAKVLRGVYPPGYQPKRNTKTMPPLPHLKQHVADLAAFLQAAPGATAADGS